MWSILRTITKCWLFAHLKIRYVLRRKKVDFGWILAAKLESENYQVGPKRPLGPT